MPCAVECPRQDSKLRTSLRRRVLYPLSYGGAEPTLRQERSSGGRDRRCGFEPAHLAPEASALSVGWVGHTGARRRRYDRDGLRVGGTGAAESTLRTRLRMRAPD